jgi:hypothetical protein
LALPQVDRHVYPPLLILRSRSGYGFGCKFLGFHKAKPFSVIVGFTRVHDTGTSGISVVHEKRMQDIFQSWCGRLWPIGFLKNILSEGLDKNFLTVLE